MLFVLLDQTNGAKTSGGESMSPPVLAAIAAAVNLQLNREFAAEYGGNYHVRAGASPTDVLGGEIPFVLLPTLADVPNAIAYHTVNGNGMPLLFDGITLSTTLCGSGNSVSCAISHEFLETGADPGANLWAADNLATCFSKEVCDPFENRTYPLHTNNIDVCVSDFALPAYFVPGSIGPYSFMARAGLASDGATRPLGVDLSLGYQMINSFNPGGIHQAAAMSTHPRMGVGISMIGFSRRRPVLSEGSRRAKRGLI